MTRLVWRSLTYHWRTNLAVCLGVATAVAVLGGALLVGDSVRGSLRDLALSRLGRTDRVISSTGYFREALAGELAAAASRPAAPLIAAAGFVTHEPSGRRAGSVLVYGVDERFWRFHGLEPRDGVFVSPALAAELGVTAGDVLLTRLQRPSEIPLESLFARKEEIGRTVRLTAAGTLPRQQLGEFALQPQQAEVRAVFAPLRRLQRDLGAAGRVNTVLVGEGTSSDLDAAFSAAVTLEDLGVRVEVVPDAQWLLVESAGGIIGDPLHEAIRSAASGLRVTEVPVFSYLANTIRVGDRQIPYSLVTGVDLTHLRLPSQAGPPAGGADALVLNDWAARELEAKPGDVVELEYYLWDSAAGLRTDTARFTVAAIVPMTGLAADRRLAPEYPGITGAESLADWDPPFPLDLSRVRPQDEAYWNTWRATPKAFISYERAAALWSTRYGRVTGVRFPLAAAQDATDMRQALQVRLRQAINPAAEGLAMLPSRELALSASAGATNFGEYFSYFSFFIVVSALILTVLFFRLGVEGRLRQVAVLRASGYGAPDIRRLLAGEAALLAVAGSLLGVAGAIAYAHVIVFGLRTWWVGAVGTTLLEVHLSAVSLAAGAAGGVAAAILCVLLSVRSVTRRSPRALLGAYSLDDAPGVDPRRARRAARLATVLALVALLLLTVGFKSPAAQVGAFFGAGASLLCASLFLLSSWLRRREVRTISGGGLGGLVRLGFRSAAFRPGRSVLSAALVASAAFVIVSVDAFRRGSGEITNDPQSGTGGFALLARSEVPIVHDPDEHAGREALLLQAPELSRARFSRFRLRPGDDASCLNLYSPANPTIVAPEPSFLEARRFTFAESLADTDEERANPWMLLRRRLPDGAVPVIADATSLQYVLHKSVGDSMSVDIGTTAPVVLRFVGALRDSVLQGELVMGEEHFVRLFPGHEGFRFFLIESPDVSTRAQAAALAEVVERELQPFGIDAVSTADRLDAFHRVENTYLSTFQALGGLGLLLGTVGLAAVMFRNVLERRRELALLRAVGYDARHLTVMIMAEAMFLLACGLAAGAGGAAIAIGPAWLGRGGEAPGARLALLLVGVLVVGALAAAAATRAASKGQLLQALRAE